MPTTPETATPSLITREMTSIGTIYTPFDDLSGMPIQPSGAAEVKGRVVLQEAYWPGLKDVEGFSHLILIYLFHRSEGYKLEVTPFMDTVPRGLFSTRAPKRPNPIGLSIVQLDSVEEGVLNVSGVDILNGTPLLDIKPYALQFDQVEDVRGGWLDKASATVAAKRSDDRFQ